MKIFDIHVHMPRNWENPDEDQAPMVDRLAEVATAAGITKACMLTGGRFGPSYERGMEILQKYTELFIPVAVIDPEEVDGEGVQRLYDMGYRGLKLIGVLVQKHGKSTDQALDQFCLMVLNLNEFMYLD